MDDFVYSPIKLHEFEVLPDSPISMQNANFDMNEFIAASPLQHRFCKQVTENEYEDQAQETTETALEELIRFMDEYPEQFEKILRRRKKEELENGGLTSFFKSRLMNKLKGEKYLKDLVPSEECAERRNQVQKAMLKTYCYAKETKGNRYNTRSSAASIQITQATPETMATKETSKGLESKKRITRSMCRVAPMPIPAAPAPPPLFKPLADRTNIAASTPCLKRPPLKAVKRTGSNVSVASVHQEILSTNPLKRLRVTKVVRSPGGTPMRRSRGFDGVGTPGLNTSESLTSVFMRIMDEKFKHVRSPDERNDTSTEANNATDSSFNISF